jgi:hypothetical protein
MVLRPKKCYEGKEIFKSLANSKRNKNKKVINVYFDLECFIDEPCECYAASW